MSVAYLIPIPMHSIHHHLHNTTLHYTSSPPLSGDKLSDKKTKDVVGSLLSALSSALRPVFVVKRMQFVMDKTKAPLAHQHYLEWLKVERGRGRSHSVLILTG